MKVLVLDKHKKPLMPCSLYRAHLLLRRGRAVVHRLHPFVIRLKDRTDGEKQDLRVKLDPGSKTTGIAVVREGGSNKGTTVSLCGPIRLVLAAWPIRTRVQRDFYSAFLARFVVDGRLEARQAATAWPGGNGSCIPHPTDIDLRAGGDLLRRTPRCRCCERPHGQWCKAAHPRP